MTRVCSVKQPFESEKTSIMADNNSEKKSTQTETAVNEAYAIGYDWKTDKRPRGDNQEVHTGAQEQTTMEGHGSHLGQKSSGRTQGGWLTRDGT
jgi:hypothetical protein